MHISFFFYYIKIWKATVVSHTPTEWVVENMPWDANLKSGEDLVVDFLGHITGDKAPQTSVTIEGKGYNSVFFC